MKMKSRKAKKTKFYSKLIGTLPKGCGHCVKGEKTVLFVTGLCPRHCSYCPISDKKYQKDVTYANEWPTSDIKDIIKEATLCSSKGAGFTGGDPLVKVNRTASYIRALKQHFGKRFHIHLYTSFDLVDEENLKMLYFAGLDEIRFHPDLDDDGLWHRIAVARRFDWDIGVEIPVVPGKRSQTIKLMDFMEAKKIKFMNLNELEFSDAQSNKLSQLGYSTKSRLSYGIKGSEALAAELLKYAEKNVSYSVHYCTATLKDKVQLSKRIMRRAKSVKHSFDILGKDGTLTRGAIYLPFLAPGFSYNDKIAKLNAGQRSFILKKLDVARNHLIKEHSVPGEMIVVDNSRMRLITNVGVVEHLAEEMKRMGLKAAIVKEYPTWDSLIIELDWM